MAIETQKKDRLETGKFPIITLTSDKETGAGKALVRGQIVKFADSKVDVYGSSDAGDIYGVVTQDVDKDNAVVTVYLSGSFRLGSIVATGRTTAQIKTLLQTTKFDDLRKLNLYFEDSQDTTEALS